MNDPFGALVRSRKFWLALIGVVQTVLFQFVPDFPPAVWQAIDGLLAVLIVTIAAEDVATKVAGRWLSPRIIGDADDGQSEM